MQKIYECGNTEMQFLEIPYPDRPFLMGINVVTQKQYRKEIGNNPSDDEGKNKPVTNVSYYDAKYFCDKLGLFLPSEEQWLFAAGELPEENIEDYAWFDKNSNDKIRKVGRKKPNEYGLFDMFGNVYEWTGSWYDRDKDCKISLGGSFDFPSYDLEYKNINDPRGSSDFCGFRCAALLK